MNTIKNHYRIILLILLSTTFCLNTNCNTHRKQTGEKNNYPQVFKHTDISGKIFLIDQYTSKTEKRSIYITQTGDTIPLNSKILTPPTFIEDKEKLYHFIENNLEYPSQQNDCQGKVILILLINKNGALMDTHIIKDIAGCPQYNDAAIKFVTTHMTKWKPAISIDHINTTGTYILPIHFK